MPNRIELASGEIAQDARISVELNPSEDRAACLIIWRGNRQPLVRRSWQDASRQPAAC